MATRTHAADTVAVVWLEEVDPRERPELARIRELFHAEPGWRVAAAAEAALAQLQVAEDIGPARAASYMQMIFAGRLVCRIEGWGGIPRKPGILGD